MNIDRQIKDRRPSLWSEKMGMVCVCVAARDRDFDIFFFPLYTHTPLEKKMARENGRRVGEWRRVEESGGEWRRVKGS